MDSPGIGIETRRIRGQPLSSPHIRIRHHVGFNTQQNLHSKRPLCVSTPKGTVRAGVAPTEREEGGGHMTFAPATTGQAFCLLVASIGAVDALRIHNTLHRGHQTRRCVKWLVRAFVTRPPVGLVSCFVHDTYNTLCSWKLGGSCRH